MRKLTSVLALLIGASLQTVAAPLPAHEWKTLREIAADYRLSDEETWLLAAIRIHENGRPGLEFGIGGPMNSGHKAHRYRDGVKSFRIQCSWAAGTIKKRYTGDLDAFGRRYNPLNAAKWTKSVRQIITQIRKTRAGTDDSQPSTSHPGH